MPRKYVENRIRSQSEHHFPDFKRIHKLQLKTIQSINQKFTNLTKSHKNFTDNQNSKKNPSMLQILHEKQFYLRKHQKLVERIHIQMKNQRQKRQFIKNHKLRALTQQSKQLENQLKIYQHQFVKKQKQKTYWGNQIFLFQNRKNKINSQNSKSSQIQINNQSFQKIRIKSQYDRQNTFILKKWSQSKQNIISSNNGFQDNIVKTDLTIPKIDKFYKNYQLFLAKQRINKKQMSCIKENKRNQIKKCQKQNIKPRLKL